MLKSGVIAVIFIIILVLVIHIEKAREKRSLNVIRNINFTDFMNRNRERLYKQGRINAKFNKQGKPTISQHDPEFKEDEWETHFVKEDRANG